MARGIIAKIGRGLSNLGEKLLNARFKIVITEVGNLQESDLEIPLINIKLLLEDFLKSDKNLNPDNIDLTKLQNHLLKGLQELDAEREYSAAIYPFAATQPNISSADWGPSKIYKHRIKPARYNEIPYFQIEVSDKEKERKNSGNYRIIIFVSKAEEGKGLQIDITKSAYYFTTM